MDAIVKILNPWDSQGNQVTDGSGIYPCIRGCGGGGYQQGYVLQHIHDDYMNGKETQKNTDYQDATKTTSK